MQSEVKNSIFLAGGWFQFGSSDYLGHAFHRPYTVKPARTRLHLMYVKVAPRCSR